MCDHFDDYEDYDDFDDSDFADEHVPEDTETDGAESQHDVSSIDPFLIGGAMGFAYEEALLERRRRKRKRERDDLE